MAGVQDVLDFKREIVCIILVIAATILAGIGVITGADWLSFAKLIGVTFVASHTVTGAVETVTTKGAAVMAKAAKSARPPPTPPPASSPTP